MKVRRAEENKHPGHPQCSQDPTRSRHLPNKEVKPKARNKKEQKATHPEKTAGTRGKPLHVPLDRVNNANRWSVTSQKERIKKLVVPSEKGAMDRKTSS